MKQGPRFHGRGVDGGSHPNLSTRKVDPNTPLILAMWRDGIPTETIAKAFGLSENAVRIRASNHGAKRPPWHISAVRGKANPEGANWQ